MLDRDGNKGEEIKREFKLPSETYCYTLRQFDDWLAANGYPTAAEQPFADITFRYRGKRLLYLMKYISYVYDSEKTL